MSNILEDIQKANDEYRKSVESLMHYNLVRDFAAIGNTIMEEALLQDNLRNIATDFYIMFTSCGGIEIEDGIPREVRGSIKLYDKWDKSSLIMSSSKDFIVLLAMGLVDMPDDGFYLCTPGALPPADKELYERALDITYSESRKPLLKYGVFGKSPIVQIPDWARYVLAQNTFESIATEIVREQKIFCFPSRYSYGMPDEIPKASKAIVQGLVDGIGIDESLFLPPTSLGLVDKWRLDVLTKSRITLSGAHDGDMEKIYCAYEVWKRVCEEMSVASVIPADKMTDEQRISGNMRKLADCLCIRPLIYARLSGVPLDDIFA